MVRGHINRKRLREEQDAFSDAVTPGPSVPHHLSQTTIPRPLILLPNGKTLTQHHNLPPLPGSGRSADPDPLPEGDPSPGLGENIPLPPDDLSKPLAQDTRHRRKRRKQWQSWSDEVIPALIGPYIRLLHRTKSLKLEADAGGDDECLCGENGRRLVVVVVRFSALERIQIQICKCRPAARQLVARGLFPCAPFSPTLAVDMRVLQFVSLLFIRIAPNHTAWCKAVEDFLDGMGYKLTTEDSLRRRFGNALYWFSSLKDATTQHVDSIISIVRTTNHHYTTTTKASVPPDVSDTPRPQSPLPPSDASVDSVDMESTDSDGDSDARPAKRRRQALPKKSVEPPFPLPPPMDRPSEYLRARCPLCFGGQFPRKHGSGPNAIACVDACFTHKHEKQERDPPRHHPRSVFLSEQDIKRMAAYVDEVRPPKPSKRQAPPAPSSEPHPDGYEAPSLKVPKSAMDGCESGFTAADDRRQKASTQYFDSTALMALLCRHDRVLWIANMDSAGEKQHYALLLIETLFQHLPPTFTVGLLYDIACQLHRTCVKWGFLSRYLNRMSFAISVFHAFGHQWPCQVIYHPRKCLGFGLADGEGCERFWHLISCLIAYTRVCGHYMRLYTLDTRIEHLEQENLLRLGRWLQRKTQQCQARRLEAEEVLTGCGHSDETLRTQWAAQVAAQTKPLPRQSKHHGKTAVEEAMRLRDNRDVKRRRVRDLEETIVSPLAQRFEVVAAQSALEEAINMRDKAEAAVGQAEQKLGVHALVQLRQLLNNPFIIARMNALAVKLRLRERLRARKFELERLERSFRKQTNEHKINKHTQDSVQRRDPSIQSLARLYNRLRQTMENLKKKRQAPRGAILPSSITMEGLFKLDVDDEIWQDVGLEDTGDVDGEVMQPPLWLSNDGVREGIKALLQRDRCLEEEARLTHERAAMQQWFSEEWRAVSDAIQFNKDESSRYQLTVRRDKLCRLCVTWMKSVQALDTGGIDLPAWGPTDDELLQARVSQVTAAVVGDDYDDDDDDSPGVAFNEAEETDIGLIEALEAVDRADGFRSGTHNDDVDYITENIVC